MIAYLAGVSGVLRGPDWDASGISKALQSTFPAQDAALCVATFSLLLTQSPVYGGSK